MKVNESRLKERFDAMNTIAVTQEGGMMRLALTEADKKGRDNLKKWMEDAGMEVKVDDLGTMYGILPGEDPDALPICIGSHGDTQPNGGKYDGLYGVMAGLESICMLNDQGIRTKSPLMLINWTNEEGARFVPPMLASGAVAGKFQTSWVHDIEDTDGIKYLEALKSIGYYGEEKNRLKDAKAYIEPHIEQGPVLDEKGLSIGIVKGALGITGLDVTIMGEANHAGTTPMAYRKDALMIASEIMLKLRDKILEYKDPAVITMGIIHAKPASKNIVPGEVYFSIDMRHDNNDDLNRMESDVKELIYATAKECSGDAVIERYWKADPVHFHPLVVDAVENAAKKRNLKAMEITSGAGHDAVFIADIIPTGMIFVPSIKGMSHCPQEDTKWSDLVAGVEVLTDVILEIDEK